MIVDLANYSAVPSSGQVARLRALGVTMAIVGTSYPARGGVWLWPAQVAAFNAGGVLTAEYQFPDALRETRADWWLDCETPAATRERVREVCSTRPPVGIYTRRSWWETAMGGWDIKAEFPALRLWDAAYVHAEGARCLIAEARTDEELRAAVAEERSWRRPFVPYGGFRSPDLVQWHGSVTLCGLNVDLSDEEEGVTQAQYDELRAAVGELLAQQGRLGKRMDDLQHLMRLSLGALRHGSPELDALLKSLGG